MSKWTLKCTSGKETATLLIKDSPWHWECLEGRTVWDATYANIMAPVGGVLQFSAGDTIEDFENVVVGSTGRGFHVDDPGSFPQGDFDWECTKLN